jgi:hypothetical protein
MHFARLDPASGLADLATNGGEGADPATTDVDPATSSGVGVDPTTSGGTTFPEAGPTLGLRVDSASGLDFFYRFTEAGVIRRPPPLTD